MGWVKPIDEWKQGKRLRKEVCEMFLQTFLTDTVSGKRFVWKFDEITKISIEPTQVLHSKASLLALSSKASKFSMNKHASLFSSCISDEEKKKFYSIDEMIWAEYKGH